MAKKEGEQPIIVIKKKSGGHGHHGGAWKVAFADFATAMMAFFLLLWLLGSTDKAQQQAVAGYFNDPASASPIGPGGTTQGIIPMSDPAPAPPAGQIDNEMSNHPGEKEAESDAEAEFEQDNPQPENTQEPIEKTQQERQQEKQQEKLRKEEQKTLDALQENLEEALKNDDVFSLLKDQVLIDITPMGLRIQIIDRENRPSFNSGSPQINFYTEEVLEALSPLIDKVPNRISVTGHTDSTAYAQGAKYTNWELSTDRANTARRALITGGYPEEKIAKIEGFADSLPFDEADPMNPINRRIAILLLKKEVDDDMRKDIGVNAEQLLEESTLPEN
jgi:chemotaxis protein MotB